VLQARELDPLDFPRVVRDDYGLAGAEYVNSFFKDKVGDFRWLGQLDRRARDAGVTSLLIMIDGEGELAASDPAERNRAVENHIRWLAAAGFLGCHSIRVNAGGDGGREERASRAADSLQRLAAQAESYGLNVLVENHGGFSSDGAWLAGVMRLADHPRVGTLPDFGNFRIDEAHEYDRYQGVAELMPWAKAVSAKSYAFDERGDETTIDYRRMLGIVDAAGYTGWVGVEYEGDGLPEPEGIRRTKALVERVAAELG
ncbi:MAG TPA: sugar phosphate isomerase/epimerase family protein, partial [Planctomycetota bacterium]|nr:sugar phosphate isomerase/epimerase family protein [Planctomycetota bacterium]